MLMTLFSFKISKLFGSDHVPHKKAAKNVCGGAARESRRRATRESCGGGRGDAELRKFAEEVRGSLRPGNGANLNIKGFLKYKLPDIQDIQPYDKKKLHHDPIFRLDIVIHVIYIVIYCHLG